MARGKFIAELLYSVLYNSIRTLVQFKYNIEIKNNNFYVHNIGAAALVFIVTYIGTYVQ